VETGSSRAPGAAWAIPALAERRTALVIGNAAYGELGALRNPVNDATDMATAHHRLSFDVTLLPDADLRTTQEAVETFVRQLRHGGVGLFYFAGYGMQVHGENYLIPLRARINREQDVAYETVPVGRILGGMEDAGNLLNIIILDACRDNPYAQQWRSVQRGLAVVQAAHGCAITTLQQMMPVKGCVSSMTHHTRPQFSISCGWNGPMGGMERLLVFLTPASAFHINTARFIGQTQGALITSLKRGSSILDTL
jgi:hypothetical protein